MIKEKLKAKGKLRLVVTDSQGQVKVDREETNLVVQSGLDYIASRMKEVGRPAEMSHMAVGSSNTGEVNGDTDLGALIGTRQDLTVDGGTVSGDQVTYTCTFGAGVSTGAIVEAGIFNALTSGDMLCRTTFNVINKGADDTLTITWVVTLSDV